MGKGRGKEVIAVVRRRRCHYHSVDVFNERHFDVLLKELYDAGIRVNVPKPDITNQEISMGGVRLNAVGTLDLDIEEVRSILAESKIRTQKSSSGGTRHRTTSSDAVQGNRVYIPAFKAVNKVDLVDKTVFEIEHDIGERFGSPPACYPAAAGFHTEEVRTRSTTVSGSCGFT